MQVESTLITRSEARQKGEGLLVPQRNSVREIFVEIGPRLDCGGGYTNLHKGTQNCIRTPSCRCQFPIFDTVL